MRTYIIESEYYNGDKYADKCHGFDDLMHELADIRKDEQSSTVGDDAKIRTDILTISVEE